LATSDRPARTGAIQIDLHRLSLDFAATRIANIPTVRQRGDRLLSWHKTYAQNGANKLVSLMFFHCYNIVIPLIRRRRTDLNSGKTMKRRFVCAALGLLSTYAMAAEPCMDNFKAEGNFLTGKTYKTWAVLSGVAQDQAFSRTLAYTVANGFTVTTSDKDAGVISAVQSVSYGKGKSVPLGIVMQPDAGNLRISMNYATSGGVMSPEDAIKRHFCMTIAAAGEGGASAAPARNTGIVPPPAQHAAHTAMRGFAPITEAQQAATRREISKNVVGEKLRPLVADAAPAIASFLDQLACLADYTAASALNASAAPGIDLQNRYAMLRPMRGAQYHDKGTCMSVMRVNGWKAPANNALQFEVVYKADDSGEVAKLQHEVVRQPDGSWLVSQ
jgi:hypothetical protein